MSSPRRTIPIPERESMTMSDRFDPSENPDPRSDDPNLGQSPDSERPDNSPILDAGAILVKLDGRSPSQSRPVDSGGLLTSSPRIQPDLQSLGGAADDANPDEKQSAGTSNFAINADRRANPSSDLPVTKADTRRAEIATAVVPSAGIATEPRGVIEPADKPSREKLVGDAMGGREVIYGTGSVNDEIDPAPRIFKADRATSQPGFPSPTVPIRDAFPHGLAEDVAPSRESTGGGNAEASSWDSGRGGGLGEFAGSQHGVSAEDLLKTNELLRQLVEETKRQRVASLPAASPAVYPGR